MMTAAEKTRVVERRAGSMERHVQTLIVVFIAGVVAWSGNSTLDLKDRVTRLDATVAGLQVSVQAASSDRYTGADAKRDREETHSHLADLEARVRILERADHSAARR